jgi:hypothetical protein
MAELAELRRTKKSILAGFFSLMAMFLLVSGFTYFFQGEHQHRWWSTTYIISLSIPMAIIPAVVWFGFVPRRIRYNRDVLEFTSRFFGVQSLPLSKLRHWGFGRNVLMLEFEKTALSRRTLQIALSFYPQAVQAEFLEFLSSNFPERKTGVWWGIKGVNASH